MSHRHVHRFKGGPLRVRADRARCLAIREQQNRGYLPDGTTRLSRDGEPIPHFMGTSAFAHYDGIRSVITFD